MNIRDLRLPSRCKFDVLYFGILRSVEWQFRTDVSVRNCYSTLRKIPPPPKKKADLKCVASRGIRTPGYPVRVLFRTMTALSGRTFNKQLLGAFAKISKSHYYLRHVYPSVRPHGTAVPPSGRIFLKFDYFEYFSKICLENSSSIKI